MDAHSCPEKSGTPHQDPPGSPLDLSRFPKPWGPWDPTSPSVGFHKETTRLSWEEESDYYLLQAYHFTDEICLLIPISHMAPRLVTPGFSHKDWLDFFFFNVWRYWLKWLSLSPPQIICLCPSICKRLWVLYLISHDMTFSCSQLRSWKVGSPKGLTTVQCGGQSVCTEFISFSKKWAWETGHVCKAQFPWMDLFQFSVACICLRWNLWGIVFMRWHRT